MILRGVIKHEPATATTAARSADCSSTRRALGWKCSVFSARQMAWFVHGDGTAQGKHYEVLGMKIADAHIV